MTSGQDQNPISPYGVSGPASSPTSDSLSTLASDPDLAVRSAVAGGLIAMQSAREQAERTKAKSPKEPNYPVWAIFLYLTIVIVSMVIFFLPSTNADHKNQALGFFFGQAPLIFSNIFKKSDKD